MSSQSIMTLLEKKKKTEKCPQKALWSFWKKRKKLQNDLKKRYSPSGKKRKMCLKSITALLEKIKTEKCPSKALCSF